MHNGILRIAIVLIATLLNMVAVHASDYTGRYLVGKFGVNNSGATGAIAVPSESTFAYGVQGAYIGGGYNWDVSAVTVGIGAYADFNSNEKHADGVAYGSRAYGMDVKLGYPVDDWLPYAKFGYGYSTGTRTLSAVAQNSTNTAVGIEYKFFARWGAIVEYKIDAFSNKDRSIRITNKTLSFGLSYYFDRPAVDKVVALSVPELDLGSEPELDLDLLASEPPPEIGTSATTTVEATPDPESWKVLQAGKSIRIDDANFVSEATQLISANSQELDEIAGFAVKNFPVLLEVAGYSDGPEPQNRKLSLGRAEEVKKYLVNRGVMARAITVKDKGPVDSVADNGTEEGRANNRRIEISATVIKIPKAKEKQPATKSKTTKPATTSAPDPDSDLDPGSLPP